MYTDYRKNQISQILELMHIIKHRFLSKASISGQLPFSQMAMLHLVEEHQGTSIKDLSLMLGITSSAVTQLVNELVDKGYLIRQDKDNDRRSSQISLTGKCREQLSELKKLQFEKVSVVFDVLSDEELELLVTLNKKLVDSFTDAKPTSNS